MSAGRGLGGPGTQAVSSRPLRQQIAAAAGAGHSARVGHAGAQLVEAAAWTLHHVLAAPVHDDCAGS